MRNLIYIQSENVEKMIPKMLTEERIFHKNINHKSCDKLKNKL